MHEQASGIADRIVAVPGDDRAKVLWAFETVQGRIPVDTIIEESIAFVLKYREKLARKKVINERDINGGDKAVWSAFARVLVTSNGFLFVD